MTYELIRVLGHGGMGKVYEASRALPGGERLAVACKIMHSSLCEDNQYKELFAREGKLCLQIANNHPGLVSVYDFLEDVAGRYCLIMELVEGCSLQGLIVEYGSLPASVVRRICIDLLDALAFIHERGFLHRDLSPCNILLSRTGEVKMSDLGLVKCLDNCQTRTANFRGKKAYASPEALRCDALDVRADLFSFGVILYEMLTGQLLFGQERERDVDESMIAASLERFPVDLRDLAKGLLRSDVAQREPTSARMARDFLIRCGHATDTQELASLVDEVHRMWMRDQKPIFEILKINGDKIEKGPDEAADHEPRRAATAPQGLAEKERKRTSTRYRALPFVILLALSLLLAYIGYTRYERAMNGAQHSDPLTRPQTEHTDVAPSIPEAEPGPVHSNEPTTEQHPDQSANAGQRSRSHRQEHGYEISAQPTID